MTPQHNMRSECNVITQQTSGGAGYASLCTPVQVRASPVFICCTGLKMELFPSSN